jgi:hypothetical protein
MRGTAVTKSVRCGESCGVGCSLLDVGYRDCYGATGERGAAVVSVACDIKNC